MSIVDWTGRLTTIGASANEVAAITAAYYADPQPVQAALDTLVNGLSNAGLLIMLNTWRTSGGPFAAGFPSGGLPFGTGVAVLTGNSADDAYPIGAGTGAKMTSIPAGDIPPLNNIPAPTGDVAMAAHKLTGLANAAANTDALNRQSGDARYVQATIGTHAARLAAGHVANRQWAESDTGLLYLDDGAAWQILNGQGSVYKTADQTVNNSATPVNDTALFFPIEINELWFCEAILWVNAASVNADWLVTWTAPTGASAAWSNATGTNSAFVNQVVSNSPIGPKTLGQTVAAGALAGDHFLGFTGWFLADATHAGNIQFQWAQNTATVENNTVKKGSFLRLRRLV